MLHNHALVTNLLVQSLFYRAATVTTSISSLLPPEARAAVFPYLDVIDVMGERKALRA